MAIIEHTKDNEQTSFYIDFRDQHGRRRKEWGGSTLKAARKREAEITLAVRAGTYEHPRDRKRRVADEARAAVVDAGPTFAEFADEFLKDRQARCRSDHYDPIVKRLKMAFAGKRLREITAQDIDDFARQRAKQVGPTTLRKELTGCGTLFKTARRWGRVAVNPAEDIEKPKIAEARTRYLTRDEYDTLEANAPPWLRPILRVAVCTGLRLREIVEARWQDYDKANGILYLTGANKTASARAVPLSAEARKVIEAQVRHVKAEHIFVDGRGKPYAEDRERNRISQWTRAVAKGARLGEVSFHTLRHTFASWLVQAGVPLYEVQTLLGHSDPKLTQRYASLRPGHLRAAVAEVDVAFGTKLEQLAAPEKLSC